MRYLWLAGLVAVAGLVLAAGLQAQDGGRRGEGMRSERRAAGEGRAGEGMRSERRAAGKGRAGEGVRSERRAAGEGRAGEGRTGKARGERRRPPKVRLTAEQEATLAPAARKLHAAIAKFKATATKTLGEKKGHAYVMQTILRQLHSERPRMTERGDKTEGRGERARGKDEWGHERGRRPGAKRPRGDTD